MLHMINNMNMNSNNNVNGSWIVVVVLVANVFIISSASVIFEVEHKFNGNNVSITNHTDHDYERHRTNSSSSLVADLPIGSSPFSGLYYTKIQIGTPPRYYYVEVDTGSDVLWVNCAGCSNCSIDDGYLQVASPKYDPKHSSSSKMISCHQDFCTSSPASYTGDCDHSEMHCHYRVRYYDGSSTTGYFVRDKVTLNGVSRDLPAIYMTRSVNFGCGTQQLPESSGFSQSHIGLGGVLGLGPSNSSVIWQLASTKTVKKTFSHCLRATSPEQPKGGVFVIGDVVHPKVRTTPLLMPKRPSFRSHYTIELKAIEVVRVFIDLSANVTENNSNSASKREAMIDIGTSFSYFPKEIHDKLMNQIFADNKLAKEFINYNGLKCSLTDNHKKIYDAMPIITFHFANDLKLKVYPHQYLVSNMYCIAFMSNAVLPEGNDHVILLGG